MTFIYTHIRGCQEITSVTFNRFCPLSNSPPLFLMENKKMDTNQNQMKNTCSFYIVFQLSKELLIKICKIKPQDLLFLFVLLAFTSADIIFHKYLKLYSPYQKRRFSSRVFFFNGFPQPPPLHTFSSQNLLSINKFFFLMLPYLKEIYV